MVGIDEKAICKKINSALNKTASKAKSALKKAQSKRLKLKSGRQKSLISFVKKSRPSNLNVEFYAKNKKISPYMIKSRKTSKGYTFNLTKGRKVLIPFGKVFFNKAHKRAGKAVFVSTKGMTENGEFSQKSFTHKYRTKGGKQRSRQAYVLTSYKLSMSELMQKSGKDIKSDVISILKAELSK